MTFWRQQTSSLHNFYGMKAKQSKTKKFALVQWEFCTDNSFFNIPRSSDLRWGSRWGSDQNTFTASGWERLKLETLCILKGPFSIVMNNCLPYFLLPYFFATYSEAKLCSKYSKCTGLVAELCENSKIAWAAKNWAQFWMKEVGVCAATKKNKSWMDLNRNSIEWMDKCKVRQFSSIATRWATLDMFW